jgi:putative oxidoreductase
MNLNSQTITLVARVLLSLAFVYSGVDKLVRWTAGEQEIAASGLPLVPLLHIVTVIVQLGGGLSVLFNIAAPLGALALCLFLVPVTFIYHPFWMKSGPSLVEELNHFLLNLGVIGGLLMIVASYPRLRR